MYEEVRSDWEDLKSRFRTTSVEDFKTGAWFADFVRWLLTNYAERVDAEYIRRRYPGASPTNQARKAISLAAKHNMIAGGLTASAISALEVSSLGPQAIITVPTLAASILAEVAYCTRTQLRTTFDLSVIHGAPLALDDVEDCYFVFLAALGMRLQELGLETAKGLGPKVVAYNLRKLLRTGLRRGLQEVLKKIGGTWLARKLTERALLRLLVPGINIPVAAYANHRFTTKMLRVADGVMSRRGKVARPVGRMFRHEPGLPKTTPLKAILAVIDSANRDAWSEAQLDALRHAQAGLHLTDEEVAALESWLDRTPEQVLEEIGLVNPAAMDDLVELLVFVAALYPDSSHDETYGRLISAFSARSRNPADAHAVAAGIAEARRKLTGG